MKIALSALTFLWGAAALAAGLPTTDAERRAVVKSMSREELSKVMQETPSDELVGIGLKSISDLGTYSYLMTKKERMKGELREAQDIMTSVREKPFAVRLQYIKGPSKGRSVLYNTELRKDDFRVREAGFLSIAGAVWINVDSNLAKKDSNHTVREAGIGNLYRHFLGELTRAKSKGGMAITHEGFNQNGHYCQLYVAPDGGKGFDFPRTRVCTVLEAGIPTVVDTFDAKDVLQESYHFSDIKKLDVKDSFFTPEGAGL